MLSIGLITIILAIAISNQGITTPLFNRLTFIVLLYSALLAWNIFYIDPITYGIGLYGGLLHVTTLSQTFDLFILIIGAIILLLGETQYYHSITLNPAYMQTHNDKHTYMFTNAAFRIASEYPLIILFTTLGMSSLISSCDLISMFLSIELQSLSLYIIATIYRESELATSAGLKYFLLGGLSSSFILLGSSLLYGFTGVTTLAESPGIYLLYSIAQGSSYINLGLVILAIGLLFKVAAAPFHNWAPDVYDGVPTVVTTWLAVMPKISIFIFLLSVTTSLQPFSHGFPYPFSGGSYIYEPSIFDTTLGLYVHASIEEIHKGALYVFGLGPLSSWSNILLLCSLASLLIGSVVGLAQSRIKRLLAYSTISHVGFMLLALGVSSEESIESLIFYIMQYSFTSVNMFYILIAYGIYMHHNNNYYGPPGTHMCTTLPMVSPTRHPVKGAPSVGVLSEYGASIDATISLISPGKGPLSVGKALSEGKVPQTPYTGTHHPSGVARYVHTVRMTPKEHTPRSPIDKSICLYMYALLYLHSKNNKGMYLHPTSTKRSKYGEVLRRSRMAGINSARYRAYTSMPTSYTRLWYRFMYNGHTPAGQYCVRLYLRYKGAPHHDTTYRQVSGSLPGAMAHSYLGESYGAISSILRMPTAMVHSALRATLWDKNRTLYVRPSSIWTPFRAMSTGAHTVGVPMDLNNLALYFTDGMIKDNYSPVRYTSQLKGRFTQNPLLGVSLAITLFSMAGTPPLVGFFGKQMIIYAALHKGYYFLAITSVLVSVISAAYYLMVIKVVFFDTAPTGSYATSYDGSSLTQSPYTYTSYKYDGISNPHSDRHTEYASLQSGTEGVPFQGMPDTVNSIIIALLVLTIVGYIFNPSPILNIAHLVSLSLFYW